MFDEEYDNDILEHYGMPRRSGRYPWGSGEDPYQHEANGKVSVRKEKDRLKKQGYSNAQIAKKLGMSINEMNAKIKTEKANEMAINVAQANKLRNKGYSNTEIARLMSTNGREVSEANVRYWLQDARKEKQARNEGLKNELRELVANKSYIDVGPGTETLLGQGISKSSLDSTLRELKQEGYELHDIQVKDPTDSSKFVHTKVLAKPGTSWAYLQNNQDEIQSIQDYSRNGGKTFNKIQYPSTISSNRVKICYAEEGGKDKDGVILIRPGVQDLSLGKAHYAQVRIAVDGTHYLKGMAMYSDDIPKGYDIVFNTNKHVGTPKLEVLKPLKTTKDGKIDKDLPFGSVIKADGQDYYPDKNGQYIKVDGVYKKVKAGSHKGEERYSLSAVNKLKEEGEWNTYSKNLSSQFLSKQHKSLIKQQLDLTYADKLAEFEEIKSCSNPIVKRKLLASFADDCDTSAVHLKASPLPGQNTKVILPLTCISDDKIYAPGYPNGTKVALVRHPHAGTFEIPVLTVDNNNRKARSILGNTPVDCVGITSKVADKLSGADFDGDTVIVIPIRGNSKIKSRESLKGLKNFDPKEKYPYRAGMHIMTEYEKGIEMGKISNLITDMTLQGAPDDKVERAVKHSMVVIDAKKHKLDYKRSYVENGIAALEREYQAQANGRYGGASTLISRAKSKSYVDEVKSNFSYRESTVSSKTGKRISGIDPKTGEKYLEKTNRYYYQTTIKVPVTDSNGKQKYSTKSVTVYKDKDSDGYFYNKYENGKKIKVNVDSSKVKKLKAQTEVTKMEKAFLDGGDAYALSSGHLTENLYANHANKMKKLANEARLEFLNTSKPVVNKAAIDIYADEVESLNNKLALAASNAPKERAARRMANAEIAAKKKEYYDSGSEWDKEDLKKASQQALTNARARTGADKKSVMIDITDREWEAIQSNAVSATTLEKILSNADEKRIKELATPKKSVTLSSAEINKIKRMQQADFTTDEIAEALGRSTSTISKYLLD